MLKRYEKFLFLLSWLRWSFRLFMLHETRAALCFRAKTMHSQTTRNFALVCLWCGRTVARSIGHVITKFSGMARFLYPWCSAGAPRARSSAKIFGQSCRENFWTPNKSDPWGQNTPFCHDTRRAKTTILPVNKKLMRFFAWNSFHLPRQFVFKQPYALFCAFCWEPFANKLHFASCNVYQYSW